MARMDMYFPAIPSSTSTVITAPRQTPMKQWSPGSIDRSPYDPQMVDRFSEYEKAAQLGVDIGQLAAGVYALPRLAKKIIPRGMGSGLTSGGTGRDPFTMTKRRTDPSWIEHHRQQLGAVRDRVERLLAQKNKWYFQRPTLEDELTTALSRHDSFFTPRELGNRGRNWTSPAGKTYTVTATRDMKPADAAMVARHEAGHYYRNMPEEAMNWRRVMDRQAVAKASRMRRMELDNIAGRTSSKADLDEWAGGTQDYFFTQRADELRERAAQLKDFIAERQGRPYNVDFHITREALDDAIDGYLASGKYDNSMTEFIHGIKDRDLLLHNMNRYALGVVPPLATSRLDTYRKRK